MGGKKYRRTHARTQAHAQPERDDEKPQIEMAPNFIRCCIVYQVCMRVRVRAVNTANQNEKDTQEKNYSV